MGAKYFNNSSLTVRKRAREQEVQRGLVLDAVGAAVRGDRLVPVLHEEVSENISHRDEQQHRERYEREVGRGHMARWSKRLGGDTVESPLTHPLVQGACVWASGRQQETSELQRQHDHRWGSPAEDADSSYAVFIHLCMEKKTGNWLQRSAVHQADVKSEKKNTQKKNSGDGLWVLDKGPVSGEVHESVVYYHAAWFSAGCTIRNLNSNCENQHGNISLAVLFPLHTMNTCVSLFVHKSVTGQWLTDVHCRIWCNTAVLNFNELLHLGNFQAGKNDITLGMSEEDFRVNRALS